jgi:hypothetical protein
MFVHDIVGLEGKQGGEEPMPCKQCDSENQGKFGSEMAIHCPGLKGLDKPVVMVFQGLLVCLNCGFTEFTVPENELRLLEQGTPARLRVAGETDS